MLKAIIKHFTRYKFYAQRSMVYFQLLNFFVIWVIFLREYDLNWWQYVIFIIFALVSVWVVGRYDRRLKVLEYEQTLYNQENKEITEIRNLLLELKNERRSSCITNTIGDTGSDDHFTDNWG